MKFFRFIKNKERGFTLIELLVVMAISAVIIPAASASIYQIITGTGLSNNHDVAINNVRNAGDWISRDARMSQISINTLDVSGFPLNMTWIPYGSNQQTKVSYVYSSTDKMLTRSYSENATATPTVITVARNVSSINCTYTNKILTLTVATNVNGVTENRVFQIKPRTGG